MGQLLNPQGGQKLLSLQGGQNGVGLERKGARWGAKSRVSMTNTSQAVLGRPKRVPRIIWLHFSETQYGNRRGDGKRTKYPKKLVLSDPTSPFFRARPASNNSPNSPTLTL